MSGNQKAKKEEEYDFWSLALGAIAGIGAGVALTLGALALSGSLTEEEAKPAKAAPADDATTAEAPSEPHDPFICPLTLEVMKDPVVTPYGQCFERKAIEMWLVDHHSCPLTRKPLRVDQLVTCYPMKEAIAQRERLRQQEAPAPTG